MEASELPIASATLHCSVHPNASRCIRSVTRGNATSSSDGCVPEGVTSCCCRCWLSVPIDNTHKNSRTTGYSGQCTMIRNVSCYIDDMLCCTTAYQHRVQGSHCWWEPWNSMFTGIARHQTSWDVWISCNAVYTRNVVRYTCWCQHVTKVV